MVIYLIVFPSGLSKCIPPSTEHLIKGKLIDDEGSTSSSTDSDVIIKAKQIDGYLQQRLKLHTLLREETRKVGDFASIEVLMKRTNQFFKFDSLQKP
uniref:Nucleotidyltransferase n=1 Tax=Rhabditophanes sp. KR3021 TaxID=114890 RepID=A0AC35TG95_9BILA